MFVAVSKIKNLVGSAAIRASIAQLARGSTGLSVALVRQRSWVRIPLEAL